MDMNVADVHAHIGQLQDQWRHDHRTQTYRDDKVGMNIKVWIKNNTSHFGEEFMSDQQDIRNGGKSESMLQGLLQYYSKLTEKKKNRRLKDPLDHNVSTNNETRATRSQNRRCTVFYVLLEFDREDEEQEAQRSS